MKLDDLTGRRVALLGLGADVLAAAPAIAAVGPTGDVEPDAPAVVYWFELRRDRDAGRALRPGSPTGRRGMKRKPNDHVIAAIHVTNRKKQSARVQQVLSRYGDFIKTRVGLHEEAGSTDSPGGVIVLELIGSGVRGTAVILDSRALLAALGDVEVVSVAKKPSQ